MHQNFTPLVVCGTIAVVYCSTIYYGLPYGILTGNTSVVFMILLMILVSLVLGLTLIAYNFQSLLELLFVHILFGWWEKITMISLIKKNLIAHKKKN
jgi:hypothetical protein